MGDIGPGGGIVFYVATSAFKCGVDLNATPATNCRNLEAAPTDYQVDGSRGWASWGCQGTTTSATATAIGTGRANTAKILLKCLLNGWRGTPIAAKVANNYSTSKAGAGQWFLPSRDELNELCKYARQTGQVAGGEVLCYGEWPPLLRDGFSDSGYWSSSEQGAYSAYYNFFGGPSTDPTKDGTVNVRPVRAF